MAQRSPLPWRRSRAWCVSAKPCSLSPPRHSSTARLRSASPSPCWSPSARARTRACSAQALAVGRSFWVQARKLAPFMAGTPGQEGHREPPRGRVRSQSRPSLSRPRRCQNQCWAAARRSAVSGSCPSAQARAARRLSWSVASPATSPCCGPRSPARPPPPGRGRRAWPPCTSSAFAARRQPLQPVLPDRLQHRRSAARLRVPSSCRSRLCSTKPLHPAEDVERPRRGWPPPRPPPACSRRRRRRGAGRAPARPARAGRSSRRWCRAASAAGPGRRALRRSAAAAAAPSRASSACGGSIRTRAAASSMASGSPSSRWQISATAGALSLSTAKSGLTAWARVDEEAHRLVLARAAPAVGGGSASRQAERRHRVLPLAAQVQRRPAGDQHLQSRRSARSSPTTGARLEQVLEVVEDQQQLLVAQEVAQPLGRADCPPPRARPERAGDGRRDQGGIGQRGQRRRRRPRPGSRPAARRPPAGPGASCRCRRDR